MKNQENNFGIVRLVAAVMVIIGHMYVLAGQNAPVFIWNSIHEIGVAVFFCIGGYLIAKSWIRKPDVIGYLLKRIVRIFPPLIFCTLVSIFMMGVLATDLTYREYYTNSLTWNYLKNMFLLVNYELPGVFMNNPYPKVVNGSLWCLPVEFMMYLAVPLWISFGEKCFRVSSIFWTISVVVTVLLGAVFASGGGYLWNTYCFSGKGSGRNS